MYRQTGFALLVMLLAVSVGSVGLLVSARDPVAREQARRGAQVSGALAHASDALRAYALADGYRNPGTSPSPTSVRPGSLPCPDGDAPPDFSADLFAGDQCPAYVGRLPHRTLDVSRIRDNEGEPLWYALDPQFRDHDNAEPINPDTPGNLTINGSGEYAAVILAPGRPVAGQSRVQSADPGNYLEAANTDGDNDFVDCRDAPACNDRAHGINVEQLLDLVPRRLLAEIEETVHDFYDGYGFYPWAAELGDRDGACSKNASRGTFPVDPGDCGSTFRKSDGGPVPDWIIDNQWYPYVYYAVAESCAGSGSSCGSDMLTLSGVGNRAVVVATTGVPIISDAKASMQDRGGTVPHDILEYLDSLENTDGDDFFDDLRNDAGKNDRLRAIAAP